MDAEERPGKPVNLRRVEAHVTTESIAVERLFTVWVLTYHGPHMPFNGVPVGRYLTRFSEYDS